ncbi:unnamed protein product [Arctia plantaginis]|uniref:Uncharacterized protein n=1 Tax=Arctia plantaginis TaxID=874455 RepID=A0A8S0YL88_ARCPL|nr:unnamed protein product [Arctia plantaginis]
MVTDDAAQEHDTGAHLRVVSKHDMLCQRRCEDSLLIVCRLGPTQPTTPNCTECEGTKVRIEVTGGAVFARAIDVITIAQGDKLVQAVNKTLCRSGVTSTGLYSSHRGREGGYIHFIPGFTVIIFLQIYNKIRLIFICN